MKYCFFKKSYLAQTPKNLNQMRAFILTATLLVSFSSIACGRKLVLPGIVKVLETKNYKDGRREIITRGKMKVLFTRFNNSHSHVYKYPLKKNILITDLSTPSDYFLGQTFSYSRFTSDAGYLKRNAEILITPSEVQAITFKALKDPEFKLDLIKKFNFSYKRISDTFNSRRVHYNELRVRLQIDKWLGIVRRTTRISLNAVDLSPELDSNYISFQIKLARVASVCLN
jgi:hypothetical protein